MDTSFVTPSQCANTHIDNHIGDNGNDSLDDAVWYKNTTIALVCAVATPVLSSFVYIIDKYAISRKVCCMNAYIAVMGCVDIAEGFLFIFLSGLWKINLSTTAVLFPILSGLCFGGSAMLYIFALDGADASEIVSLENTYPLFVAALSFFILGEQIGAVGLIGIGITCLGAVLISLDPESILTALTKTRTIDKNPTSDKVTISPKDLSSLRKRNTSVRDDVTINTTEKTIPSVHTTDKIGNHIKADHCRNTRLPLPVLMIPLIFLLGSSEFFTKLGTGDFTPLEATTIGCLVYGISMLFFVVMPDARRNFVVEAKHNWMWPIVGESIMLASNTTLAIAMASLPAPVVSAIAASSPLFTFFIEIWFGLEKDVSSGNRLHYRLFPIILSVVGIGLLSLEVT